MIDTRRARRLFGVSPLVVVFLLLGSPVSAQTPEPEDSAPTVEDTQSVVVTPEGSSGPQELEEQTEAPEGAEPTEGTETFELLAAAAVQRHLSSQVDGAWKGVLEGEGKGVDYPALREVREMVAPKDPPSLGEAIGAQLLILAAEMADQAK